MKPSLARGQDSVQRAGWYSHGLTEQIASSAPPGSRQRDRLIAVGEVVVCSGLPTQFLLQNLAVVAGMNPWQAANVPAFAFVVVTQMADAVLLIALMVTLMRAHGESPRALWLGARPAGREGVIGLALIPLVFLVVGLLLTTLITLAPGLHNVKDNPLEQLPQTPMRAAVFAVVVIVAGGVREELQRAFLLRRFEQHLGGAGVGVVVLSAAFGAGHYLQGWDATIATGVLGALWAIVYLRRRSSIAPMVSHAGFDALQVIRVALFP